LKKILFIVFLIPSIFLIYLLITLPSISKLEKYTPNQSSKIYSYDGILLAEFYKEENREFVPIEKISQNIINAVIANEDINFYHHWGFSIEGICRALLKDLKTGSFSEGGSTITQQVAKNAFLTQKKTIRRKIREIILAILIDFKYSKKKILEVYLNQIYYGNNLYGIESASEFYFEKHASELWLSEASLLAGILKAPEYYNPLTHFDRTKTQQKLVLDKMVRQGVISRIDANMSFSRSFTFNDKKKRAVKYPYFVAYVFDKLYDMYGERVFYNGYKIHTTLDSKMQDLTERVIRDWTRNSLNISQFAVLGVNSKGGIEVMHGGVDFYQSQWNRCYQSKRPMGSTFKPLVYLTAIEKGYGQDTLIDDFPISYDDYIPRNYNNESFGLMTLTDALVHSNNIATIKLMETVGVENVMDNARLAGITDVQPIISLALGVSEASLFNLVNMYNIFANLGKQNELYSIEYIEDKDKNVVYQHESKEKQVFLEENIVILNRMLQKVVEYGTGRNAGLYKTTYGKTGTTDNYKDAWFIGFTDNVTYGVWVGNDNNEPMHNVTGG